MEPDRYFPINWGIIGTGWIAVKMVEGISVLRDAKIKAIASRRIERAKELALRHRIVRPYGSYEEIARDPDIDVIYYEAEEVMRCLPSRAKESDFLPLAFSLQLVRLMDRIRKEIGLVYAADTRG